MCRHGAARTREAGRGRRAKGALRLCRAAIILAGVACLLAAGTEAADDGGESPRRDFSTPALTAPWRIEVGGGLNAFKTRAAWAPAGLNGGSVILLEETLGLDEETATYAVRIAHRFNRRHSIELYYTDLRRTATRQIDHEIDWGDYVFRAEGRVWSELETKIARLKYKYDFSDTARLNAGFTAGLSTFDLGLRLQGEARLENDDGQIWVDGVVESASVIAPVPVVGFFLEYALTPRLCLMVSSETIVLEISDYSGRVVQSEASLEYAFSDLFGVGLTLGGNDIEVGSDKNGERFGLEYRISSVGLRATFSF